MLYEDKLTNKVSYGEKENEIVGWYHQVNGHEFEQAPGDSETCHAAAHGVTKSHTQFSDWTTTTHSQLMWNFSDSWFQIAPESSRWRRKRSSYTQVSAPSCLSTWYPTFASRIPGDESETPRGCWKTNKCCSVSHVIDKIRIKSKSVKLCKEFITLC